MMHKSCIVFPFSFVSDVAFFGSKACWNLVKGLEEVPYLEKFCIPQVLHSPIFVL